MSPGRLLRPVPGFEIEEVRHEDPEKDTRRAVEEGVDAIVVSNHGGNVLDGTMPTLTALPEIAEAVGDEIEVLLDSGVRRGTDVLKALALGAKAVLLGRAYVYPLLAAGEPGVRHMLELFRQQIDEGLAFLGARSIHELDPSYLHVPENWPSSTRAAIQSMLGSASAPPSWAPGA